MARAGKLVEAETPKLIDQSRRDEIAAGLKREFYIEIIISAAEWSLLEDSLNRFQQSFVDWDGYLNKGEIAKMRRIKSTAEKLLLAIKHTESSGLGRILEYELAPITPDQVLTVLNVLAKTDPRSPKTDDRKKRVGMRRQDDLKAGLQLELDNWWKLNTGFSTETKESEETPFSFFMEQIFETLPSEVVKRLGHSRTAVSERRRRATQINNHYLKIAEIFKTFLSQPPPAAD